MDLGEAFPFMYEIYLPEADMADTAKKYFNYTAQVVFWGELGGLLEAIDGDATTIVDHVHCSLTEDHTLAGLLATETSGIRSIYCPSLVPKIKQWNEAGFELDKNPIPDWFLPTLRKLCERTRTSNGRLSIGLGFDGWYLPKSTVIDIFQQARSYGTKPITCHWQRNIIAASEGQSVPLILRDYGLLGPDIILSHATGSTDEEFHMMKIAGVSVSATPATESQMAHGEVAGFRSDVIGPLGSDCGPRSRSLISQLEDIESAESPEVHEPTTLQAFNLATIQGARAIHLDKEIGSLREGKRADLVIFDTDTPSMTCAVDHDPMAAVVRHATNREVPSVMVDGRWLKRNGKLLDAALDLTDQWEGWKDVQSVARSNELSWSQVAKQLRRSRREIQARIESCNIEAARKKVMELWGFRRGEDVFA